jgi:hypothetical protein
MVSLIETLDEIGVVFRVDLKPSNVKYPQPFQSQKGNIDKINKLLTQ